MTWEQGLQGKPPKVLPPHVSDVWNRNVTAMCQVYKDSIGSNIQLVFWQIWCLWEIVSLSLISKDIPSKSHLMHILFIISTLPKLQLQLLDWHCVSFLPGGPHNNSPHLQHNHTPNATPPFNTGGFPVGGVAAPPHHVIHPNRYSTCSSDSDEIEEESGFAKALREKKNRVMNSTLATDSRKQELVERRTL